MVPIDTINATSDVELNDSCNCWSSCCRSKEAKKIEKDQVLKEKIREIVMQELAKK